MLIIGAGVVGLACARALAKGALEEWFVANKSVSLYFIAIFITIWVVIFPKTRLVWTVFKELPKPPRELKQVLKYAL